MTQLTGPAVVRDVVEQKLRRLDGDAVVDKQGDFVVRRAEQTAWVRIVGVESDLTIVVVFAIVATDLDRVDDACRFLAAESLELPMCHFELHGDGRMIIASHSLLGEFLSGAELGAAIDAVTAAAGRYGPKVQERFGGRTSQPATPPTIQLAEIQRMAATVAAQAQQRQRAERARQRSRVVGAGIGAGIAVVLFGSIWSWWGTGLVLVAVLLIAYIARRTWVRARNSAKSS